MVYNNDLVHTFYIFKIRRKNMDGTFYAPVVQQCTLYIFTPFVKNAQGKQN